MKKEAIQISFILVPPRLPDRLSNFVLDFRFLGRIRLNDRVFGPGSILGSRYAGGKYSLRERRITVQQLLEHTAGGTTWNNQNKGGIISDPMFIRNNLNHEQLIKYILQTRDPSHYPGRIFSYSNFGYAILGRIIEKVTRMPYEKYVKKHILNPMKAYQFYVGGNTLAQRRYWETIYYQKYAYSMNVRRLDSSGGWITRPIDLVRFMVHVDGFKSVRDKLKKSTIKSMVKPSKRNKNYAKGWSVNRANNWWHGGSLPGTMTILVRTRSGYTWSFMCNRRGSGNIDRLMWQIVNGVKKWPKVNFF